MKKGKILECVLRNKVMFILFFVELIVLCSINNRLFVPIDEIYFSVQEIYDLNRNLDIDLVDDRISIDNIGEAIAIRSPRFTLQSGAYTMSMSYLSNKDGRGSITESTGQITYCSAENKRGLRADLPVLYDGKDLLETRIFQESIGEMEEVYFLVMYTGEGTLSFGDIQLEESFSNRILKCLFSVMLVMLINVAYCLWKKNRESTNGCLKNIVCIGVIAIGASLPFMTNFLYSGHDASFHLNRITMLASELSNGQFPVRITRDYFMNQYGYVNSLFYCDIFLYIPAILYNCGASLLNCYQVYIIGINLITASIAYYSFKKITNQSSISIIGAAIYTLSFYRLICIYTRAALGEYTAMAFLPLIVVGMYMIYTKENIRIQDWILLSLGMSGVILSHVLTTQMTTLFLILFCIFYFKRTIQFCRIIALGKAAITTVLLTGWFVGPMLQSMNMGIVMVEREMEQVQSKGLSLVQLFGIPYSAFGGNEPINMLQQISMGPALLVGLGVIGYCCLKFKEWKLHASEKGHAMVIMTILVFIALVFTLQWFPWDDLELFMGENVANMMRTIQFPYRYLTIASVLVVTTTLVALQFCYTQNRGIYRAVIIMLLSFTILSAGEYYGKYIHGANYYTGAYRVDIPTIYKDYLLEEASIEDMAISRVHVSDTALLVEGYKHKKGDIYINLCNTSNDNIALTMPVQDYDHFVLRDLLTSEQYHIERGENACITTRIPPYYEGTLVLTYEVPFLWRVFEITSVVTAIIICILLGYKAWGEAKNVKS